MRRHNNHEIDKDTIMTTYPVSTGHDQIDRFLHGGFTSGSVTVITGAPRTGKSTMMTELAVNAMKNKAVPVVVGLEDDIDMLRARFITKILADEYIQYNLGYPASSLRNHYQEYLDFDWYDFVKDHGYKYLDLNVIHSFLRSANLSSLTSRERKVLYIAREWLDNVNSYFSVLARDLDQINSVIENVGLEQEEQLHDHVDAWGRELIKNLGVNDNDVDDRYRQFREHVPFPTMKPVILFVDEFSFLDDIPENSYENVLESFRDIARRNNIAVVISTRDRHWITKAITDENVLTLERGEHPDEVLMTTRKGPNLNQVTLFMNGSHQRFSLL